MPDPLQGPTMPPVVFVTKGGRTVVPERGPAKPLQTDDAKSKPIACPNCRKPLTDEQIRSIKARYSRRFVTPTRNGGRRKPPHEYDTKCRCRVCLALRQSMRRALRNGVPA